MVILWTLAVMAGTVGLLLLVCGILFWPWGAWPQNIDRWKCKIGFHQPRPLPPDIYGDYWWNCPCCGIVRRYERDRNEF